MNENRSLEDFLGGSGDGKNDGAGDGKNDGAGDDLDDGDDPADSDVSADRDEGVAATDTTTDPKGDVATADGDEEAVEPATPTYRWDRGGAVCEGCGETVERRWADGDAFVCVDCKEW